MNPDRERLKKKIATLRYQKEMLLVDLRAVRAGRLAIQELEQEVEILQNKINRKKQNDTENNNTQ